MCYVQGLVEPGRKAELRVRLGCLVPSLAGGDRVSPTPNPRTNSPSACPTLWVNKSLRCNRAGLRLPAAPRARLCVSAYVGSQTRSLEPGGHSLPLSLCTCLPGITLPSQPESKDPARLGTQRWISSSPRGPPRPPYSGLTDPQSGSETVPP